MFDRFKKKNEEKGFTDLDKKIDYLGISFNDFFVKLSIDESRKIMKKSIDEHIKKLPKMKEDELKRMREDIKEKRKNKYHFPKFIKDQFPHEKVGYSLAELQRLFEAVDQELVRRKSD